MQECVGDVLRIPKLFGECIENMELLIGEFYEKENVWEEVYG